MIHLPASLSSASSLISFQIQSEQKSNTVIRTIRRLFAHNTGGFIFLAAILLAGTIGAHAQAPTLAPGWNQQSPATSPPPRYVESMTYDAGHGQVVLFGGFGAGDLNDTWLWNGSNWAQASPMNSPSVRAAAPIAYDAAHGQVVLFGGLQTVSGVGSVRLGDTWLWDGTNWTQANPANSPTARANSMMVYDPTLGKVVMFGGVIGSGSSAPDGSDTWLWDGSNWSQMTTAHSPSARDSYGMVYDPALGEVVMFGGESNGTPLGDTWAFDGIDWTQLSPSMSPSARYASAMVYDAALGEIVLWGGYNGSFLTDTWVLNGGGNWTQVTTSANPSGRFALGGSAYDAAQNQMVLFGGYNGSEQFSDTWIFGTPQNFGNVSACTSGSTLPPSSCNLTMPLVFSFSASSTTVGSIQVLTQGASNLDFTIANTAGTNCINTWSAGNSCTVLVNFAPLASGLRTGAVELLDNSGNLLVTAPIYGTGEAPEIAFGPAATNSASGLEIGVPNVGVANQSYTGGMTTDASGNLYTGVGSNLLKVVPGGTPTTVATGFVNPVDVAIDGAGNLYVADTGLNSPNGEVVELAPTCASVSCGTVVYAPLGPHPAPRGVAVDGLGDVFIADNPAGVFEVPAGCTSSSCWITVGSGWSTPEGVAVDSSGDLFVADPGLKEVVEIPAGCTAAGCQTLVGSGWVSPQSVAVDAAGDVIVADPGLNSDAGGVVEVPAGCTSSNCQVLSWTDEPASPFYVAVNEAGQVFVANDGANPVVEINAPLPPSESFAATSVGSTGTQSFTVLNVGNQTMSVLPANMVSPFQQIDLNGTPADCTKTGQGINLAPGQSCNLSIQFAPTAAQSYSGNANLQDDSLWADFPFTSFALSGTGQAPTNNTLNVSFTGEGSGTVIDNLSTPITDCIETNNVLSGACSESYSSTTYPTVTLTATASAGSIFVGWGGACASAGTNPQCVVTMIPTTNVAATFSPQALGSINVCAGGVAAGCIARTFAVSLNVPTSSTVSSVNVVTQGQSNLDFTPGAGSSCPGFVGPGTCIENVDFAPIAPGLRLGAVQLLDSSNNVLATQLISGVGQGPEIAFTPATQTTEPLANVNYPVGVALDGSGNLYIANYGGSNPGFVDKITPGNVESEVLTSYTSAPGQTPSPIGVAVDGAGNLFISDLYLPNAVKLTPSGVQTTVGSGLNFATDIALDGAGDAFIADQNNKRIVEVTPAGVQTTVPFTGLTIPWGVAVDAAGDVFVTDGDEFATPTPITPRVLEYSASGVQTTIPVTGLSRGYHLAVDAAGDLFIADFGNGNVVEYSATGVQTTVGTGLGGASGVTVDAAGDVFIGDQGDQEVAKVSSSQPELWNFESVNVGSRSNDVGYSIQNIGNQNLIGTVGSASNSNFAVDLINSTCTSVNGISLTPGATCVTGIYAQPTASGLVSGSVPLTDNSLNGSPTLQFISVEATGVATSYTLTITAAAGTGSGTVTDNSGAINCSMSNGSASGTCSASYAIGANVILTAAATSGSTFTSWGGACSGIYQICTVIMNSAQNVSATFTASATYPVSVTLGGTGTGSVTSNIGGITCSLSNGTDSGTCAANYSAGTQVTLTANPTGNSIFVGWGGDCASSGSSTTCLLTVNSALNPIATFVAPPATQPGNLQPITAGVVYGQSGSFTTNTENPGGTSANTLGDPAGSVLDSNGNLYVGDTGNDRVLFYPRGSTTPTRVYGQGGSFTTAGNNQGGISANSLNNPYGVALDSSGNLYVADLLNNRVLFYPAGSTTATRVYGQNGSFTTNTANNGGVSANSLDQPYAVALDSSGNLYVAEIGNNRVLFYPAGSTTATRVYGQNGSFTTNTANNGGISANSLNEPLGLALDSSGDLYVADELNNRVLFYPSGGTTATRVYGQGGIFTTGNANNGGISANSLYQPFGVSLDGGGDLYIGDTFNNRVLFYPFGSTTATRVYGQLGSFTSNSANPGGVSANTLVDPEAVPLDSSGNLYVADYGNNRVVEYGNFGNVNVCPSGQSTPAPCNSTITLSYYAAAQTNFGATQVVTQGATGLDFSLANGNTCTGTIAAGNVCLVNATFTPLAPGLRAGAAELYDNNGNSLATALLSGIGQAPLAAFGPGTQGQISTGTFSLVHPAGLLVDTAGNLFISDADFPRVLKVAPNGSVTSVGSGFKFPQGMAEDGAGDLFVADNNQGQVVEIPAGCTTSTCQQFVPNPLNLQSQLGVAVDGAGDLFIGDFLDGKVAEVPANGGPQSIVYNPTGCGNAPGCSDPVDLTTDAAGDLFVADFGLKTVAEVPVGCTSASCVKSIGSGWNQPDGVAVDAAGDVFVADEGLSEIVEVPFGCTTSACQIVLASGVNTVAVKLDSAGDLFFDNLTTPQILAMTRSLPPSLNFALTGVGNTSADSPQAASVQNVGNQSLSVSVGSTSTTSFIESPPASACGTTTPSVLAPGSFCYEGFSFTPQSTGILTDSASFSDNTLNVASSVVLQTVNLSGTSSVNGATGAIVPDVMGMTEAAAATALTDAGLTVGSVTSGYSSSEPQGTVGGENPAAGAPANLGSAVNLLIATGEAPPPTPTPLTFENNYFVTGDYATGGVTLHGAIAQNGVATGTITIPDLTTCSCSQGVPDGADIVDAFLYWTTIENTATPSGNTGTFLGFSISGQQVGSDIPSYSDGTNSGTLRVYRADVNTYFQVQPSWNGERLASGNFSVSLPDVNVSGGQLTVPEGASMVVIYRALVAPKSTSPLPLPLKSVVIYDGSTTTATTQTVQGFYDATGANGEVTTLSTTGGSWNNSASSASLTLGQSQYGVTLNSGTAYAAVILSTPVANTDNDGILDSWKSGPSSGFFAHEPGYYDVKTQSWVPLPGAKSGEQDLFVQLDWMCGAVLSTGQCDPSQENLFPSPDADGNDPLAMVTQAFANMSPPIVLHLEVGNAVPESTCTDSPGQLCQFPGEPGVIGWKNSLEFSKIWPRNFTSCAAGGDCTARFPYGMKDSYHYVLFGHSLAIPAWNTRFGSLTAISVASGVTTITTTDRGTGINECPSRITISGVLSNSSLNGVYNTSSCPDTKTIIVSTPGVPNWTYSYATNTPPEPAIGLTSGTVTSISGYSDLGGADSAVTLALWETDPTQDMSKRAQVIAGTLFHEIGHTIGLTHGGLYYQGGAGSYVPTFDINCKPNYQSSMNYLFQLDGVGLDGVVAYSNQTLETLSEATLNAVGNLVDINSNPATISSSAWYAPAPPTNSTESAATLHCDGSPLNGDTGYFVQGSVAPVTPSWVANQDITFDGVQPGSTGLTGLPGYSDTANIDLRQIGATGGEFAALASILSFGNSTAPLTISPGGNVSVGPGGTVTVPTNGSISLAGTGTATVSGGAMIASSGTITLGTGGSATFSNGPNTVTPGSNGVIALPPGGTFILSNTGTLSSTGTLTVPSGGTITLGAGGNVTLGGGGTITIPGTLGSPSTQVVIPAAGGSYDVPAGGTITLGGGGNVTLGAGGNVTLGGGGNITLGAGGNITLGAGGNVTLGAGGTVTLGGGGNVTLGGGGNITLGGGGTITLGGGGTVTLGGGGNVTLGGGGNVTLGGGGNITLGAGGNVTLGAGGTVTLGAGGNVTLGGGGNITLGGGGVGTITVGGVVVGGCSGSCSVPAGGTVTLGGGGTVTLGGGGNVTLGGGGNVTLGAGGNITLGGGGNVTLGGGGNVTLGGGGANATEMDYDIANSVVRAPVLPTYTVTGGSVQVSWMAPAFGVVQSYTISRSVNHGTPVVIGTVTGANGNPPATTFPDANPPTGTLTYTIATTLVPDSNGSQRQSAPSVPAVVTLNQTIVLGTLQSSYTISNSPVSVTATASSGLTVSFSASGSCSVGSSSPMNGGYAALVSLAGPGSCTITASQAGNIATAQSGATEYNAATPVSATFAVVLQNSSTTPQVISFPQLPNVRYGSTFALNATDNSGLTISYTITAPCTLSGTSTGVGTGIGTCTVTASAPAGTLNNTTYSSAQVSQSFNVIPAILTVTAGNLTSPYGQIPSLTSDYGIAGFVNGESASVLNGAPALSTTATTTSNPAIYPITVAMGSLTAANYTFAFVPGTLTIREASQTISFTPPTSPVTYGVTPISLTATSTSGLAVLFSIDPASTATGSIAGNILTVTSAGSLVIDANQAGNSNYAAAAQIQRTVVVNPATATISISNIPANPVYGGSFMPMYSYSGTGTPTESTSSSTMSICTVSGGTVSFIGVGPCTLTAKATATTDDSAATGNPQSFNVAKASQSITFTQPASPVTYGVSPISLTATSTSGLAVAFSVDASSTAKATISGSTLTINGAGTLVIDANQVGNSDYQAATQVQRTVVVSQALLTVTGNNLTRAYGAANPPLTVTYSGFVNRDTSAVLTGSPALSTTATTTSLPGSYPITVSQGTLATANYTFKFVNGTLTVTYTASVPPSGTACNGAYSGTFSGNLTVSKGQNCVFIGGGATGSITETGGNLALDGSTIGSGVTVNSGGTFTIGPSTTIKGNLTIESLPKSTTANQVCGTTITGNLVIQSNGTPFLVGSGTPSCAGNIIKGSLQVASNSAAVTMDGNGIAGSLQVQSNAGATTIDGNTVGVSLQDQSNAGATQVFDNIITNALQCQSNASITGGGNTAASKSGQCAKF